MKTRLGDRDFIATGSQICDAEASREVRRDLALSVGGGVPDRYCRAGDWRARGIGYGSRDRAGRDLALGKSPGQQDEINDASPPYGHVNPRFHDYRAELSRLLLFRCRPIADMLPPRPRPRIAGGCRSRCGRRPPSHLSEQRASRSRTRVSPFRYPALASINCALSTYRNEIRECVHSWSDRHAWHRRIAPRKSSTSRVSELFALPWEGHSHPIPREAFNAFNDCQLFNRDSTSRARLRSVSQNSIPVRVMQFALRYEF